MARSNIPLDFTTPDFARVREESGVFTEEEMRSLYVLSVDSRRRLLGIEQMFGWQDVAFAAGNFTANSGTWTVSSGDQQLYRYTKIGRVLSLNFFLEDTTTGSGMGTQLRSKMPKGMKARATTYMGPLIVRGSVETEGYVTTEGTDTLYCYRTDHAGWPSSITNNVDIRGTITCQVAE